MRSDQKLVGVASALVRGVVGLACGACGVLVIAALTVLWVGAGIGALRVLLTWLP